MQGTAPKDSQTYRTQLFSLLLRFFNVINCRWIEICTSFIINIYKYDKKDNRGDNSGLKATLCMYKSKKRYFLYKMRVQIKHKGYSFAKSIKSFKIYYFILKYEIKK